MNTDKDKPKAGLPICVHLYYYFPICSRAAKIWTEARSSQGLNRGIREIRGKEMERGSLPASAYFAYSAVTLATSVAVGRAVVIGFW